MRRWPVAVVVKPDRMNVHLASTIVPQDETPFRSTVQFEPVSGQQIPHTRGVVGEHNQVQVSVGARLLAEQSINTPTTVDPHVNIAGAQSRISTTEAADIAAASVITHSIPWKRVNDPSARALRYRLPSECFEE
jgi:hypothetical protein